MNTQQFPRFSVSRKTAGYIVLFTLLVCGSAVAAINGVLKDFNGKIQSLDDYTGKGKWVVVMLWASDCGVCNKEVHQYVAFHKKNSQSNANVLGISLDGDSKINDAREFITKHSVNFPNLITDPQTAARLYELSGDSWKGTPSFMVFKPDGELVGAQTGAVPASVIESFIANESQTEKKS